jgi:hypothetical protein
MNPHLENCRTINSEPGADSGEPFSSVYAVRLSGAALHESQTHAARSLVGEAGLCSGGFIAMITGVTLALLRSSR